MRVAHVSPTFFGDGSVVGGGERYALELSRALAKQVTTTLITFSGQDDALHVQHDGDLEIRRYPVKRFVMGNLANPFTLTFLKDLRSFDVIHCYGYPNALTDLCMLFASILRKKLVVTDVHGGGSCASTYLARLGLDTRRFIDGFPLLSEYNARHYARYHDRVHVIGGGVDDKRFCPAQVPKAPRVLYVGRLIPVKGIDDLIAAVMPETPLCIVGRPYDQDYYRTLRKMSSGKSIEFLTSVPDADLSLQYSSALVTVVPSVYTDLRGQQTPGELFGLVAVESMACGTPVIATRCGGLPEVVEDGVTGFIVPPNDRAAIRDRIQFFFHSPEAARTMGLAGRERVLRLFTWDVVAEKCLHAYRQALAA